MIKIARENSYKLMEELMEDEGFVNSISVSDKEQDFINAVKSVTNKEQDNTLEM